MRSLSFYGGGRCAEAVGPEQGHHHPDPQPPLSRIQRPRQRGQSLCSVYRIRAWAEEQFSNIATVVQYQQLQLLFKYCNYCYILIP